MRIILQELFAYLYVSWLRKVWLKKCAEKNKKDLWEDQESNVSPGKKKGYSTFDGDFQVSLNFAMTKLLNFPPK